MHLLETRLVLLNTLRLPYFHMKHLVFTQTLNLTLLFQRCVCFWVLLSRPCCYPLFGLLLSWVAGCSGLCCQTYCCWSTPADSEVVATLLHGDRLKQCKRQVPLSFNTLFWLDEYIPLLLAGPLGLTRATWSPLAPHSQTLPTVYTECEESS